jgi:hypothetical protein
MERILKGKELNKKRVKKAYKAKHKIEGKARQVITYYSVIIKGNAKLYIAKRA